MGYKLIFNQDTELDTQEINKLINKTKTLRINLPSSIQESIVIRAFEFITVTQRLKNISTTTNPTTTSLSSTTELQTSSQSSTTIGPWIIDILLIQESTETITPSDIESQITITKQTTTVSNNQTIDDTKITTNADSYNSRTTGCCSFEALLLEHRQQQK